MRLALTKLVRGIVGKRLTYMDTSPAPILAPRQLELPMAMPRRPRQRPRRQGTEYQFKIDAWTPDTLPMSRLVRIHGGVGPVVRRADCGSLPLSSSRQHVYWFTESIREAVPKGP